MCLRLIQVFNDDIHNLLSMSDMWRSRAPPVPLDFEAIKKGTFVLRPEKTVLDQGQSKAPLRSGIAVNGSKASKSKVSNGSPIGNKHRSADSSKTSSLKDQRKLTLLDNLLLFISRLVRHRFVLRYTTRNYVNAGIF
jgi:ubiquitin-like 1-activating enzyme E1 B